MFLVIRTFMMQAFRIPTSSMEQTLLAGDHLLTTRLYSSFDPAAAGRLRSATAARWDRIGKVIR